MSALGAIPKVLTDPAVLGVVLPLARQVARWVRGGKRPEWLGGALREVPSLRTPVALAEAKRRARG